MVDTSTGMDTSLVHADVLETGTVLTRLLDAPRELVFDVWTDPKHLEKWWGPAGFSITDHGMDVKPEGTWRFDMHHAEYGDFPNLIVYEEVVRPERLVYSHGSGVDDGKAPFHVTVTFEDQGGKTLLTMRTLFASAEAFNEVKQFGAIEGGKQTLTRLAEYLARA